MTLTGGKRKVNKSLKAWVVFVKKVQKEERLSYKDAIKRAKQRKDKGEKWMTGGESSKEKNTEMETEEENDDKKKSPTDEEDDEMEIEGNTRMNVDTEPSPQTVDTQRDTEENWIHSYQEPGHLAPIRNASTDEDDEYYRNHSMVMDEDGFIMGQGGKRHKKRKTMKKSHKKRRSTRRRGSRRR